jgi:hypothetical protein
MHYVASNPDVATKSVATCGPAYTSMMDYTQRNAGNSVKRKTPCVTNLTLAAHVSHFPAVFGATCHAQSSLCSAMPWPMAHSGPMRCDDPNGACHLINTWAMRVSNGLIESVLSPNSVT